MKLLSVVNEYGISEVKSPSTFSRMHSCS